MSLPFPLDRFQQPQHAIAGYLLACPFFNGIPVYIATPQIQPDGTIITAPQIQSAIDQALSGITQRNGMSGAAAIVGLPILGIWDHKSNVPQEQITVGIRFIENILFNNAETTTVNLTGVSLTSGNVNASCATTAGLTIEALITGDGIQDQTTIATISDDGVSFTLSKTASSNESGSTATASWGGTFRTAMAYADEAVNQLHAYRPSYQWGMWGLRGQEGRTCVPVLDTSPDANPVIRQYQSFFYVLAEGRSPARVADPDISLSGSTAILTCPTAGALIYYTLNGTYPYAGNSTAFLYSAPFTVSTGQLLKVVAYPAL